MAAPVSYQNEVMAVLAKAGCNMGTCHGNAMARAASRSACAENPRRDWKVIARNELGRRLNLIEPDESLLLKKPPHKSHTRGDDDSRWIRGSTASSANGSPKAQE